MKIEHIDFYNYDGYHQSFCNLAVGLLDKDYISLHDVALAVRQMLVEGSLANGSAVCFTSNDRYLHVTYKGYSIHYQLKFSNNG